MSVSKIDEKLFKEKIWDFDASPKSFVFKGEVPAIVDFYATWCGPCRMLSPVMESLSGRYEGKVDFYKVDTDEQERLCEVFGISSIPTLLLCSKDGRVEMTRGYQSEQALCSMIENTLRV